jgi:hypothetical protein
MTVRNWTELTRTLTPVISTLSEINDKDLRMFLQIVERAYVHALIEEELRSGRLGVSRVATPLRSV